jgi:hypothetical protein
MFVATLSDGPVGVGDGLGNTNKTLLMRCCDDGGAILGPTVGLGSIDATWAQGRFPPRKEKQVAAAVWSAHTGVGDMTWHYVVSIDVPTSFQLLPTDLWPRLDSRKAATLVVHRRWHASPCTDGTTASDCGVILGFPDVMTGLPPQASPVGTHNWELFTVSPVTHGGVALVGEVDKVTAVSVRRFGTVNVTADEGIRCSLVGAPHESVRVVFVVGVGVSGGATGSRNVFIDKERGHRGTRPVSASGDMATFASQRAIIAPTIRVTTVTLSGVAVGFAGVDPNGTVWEGC